MSLVMIFYFAIVLVAMVLAWIIGRAFVLPHVMVFPELMPVSFWKPLYNFIFHLCLGAMHWILAIILVLYLIYCFLRKVFPPFLALPPLKALKDSGLVDLLDSLVDIWFSSMPLLEKIIETIRALARFVVAVLYLVYSFLRGMFTWTIGIPPLVASCNLDQEKKPTPAPKQTTYNGGIAVTNSKVESNPNSKIQVSDVKTRDSAKAELNKQTLPEDTGGEPMYFDSLTEKENAYIDKDYRQCIFEKYTPVTKEMDKWDKLRAKVRNITAQSECSTVRILNASNLISSKI